MPNSLRQYQAKQLYQQFDQWYSQRMSVPELVLTIKLQGSGNLAVSYDNTVVHQQPVDGSVKLDIKIPQNSNNRLNIVFPANCIIDQILLDNFDLMMFVDQTTNTLNIDFACPFVDWYNSQISLGPESHLIGDAVITNNQSLADMQNNILRLLDKLKY